MKYISKNEILSEFEKVIKILDKEVSLNVIRKLFIVLHPEKAELNERIRSCELCQCFFWAKRLNKNIENEACQKCNNVRRQELFLSKNRERVATKRRKIYAERKSIRKKL